MASDWYAWRTGTLKPCKDPAWQGLYGFFGDLLLDIEANPTNYGWDKYTHNQIDWRVMLYLFRLFATVAIVDDGAMIDSAAYQAILKEVRAASYKKLPFEGGLAKFGFAFTENAGVMHVRYPKDPSVLPLLHAFAAKCASNKGNGFLAFLRCDLEELARKTTVDIDFVLSRLDAGIRAEILRTDGFARSLKGVALKRQVTFDCIKGDFWDGGTIKYVSKAGFCYTIHLNRNRLERHPQMEHNAWWYIMPVYKGERWKRINDLTVPALEGLSIDEPESADRLFDKLKTCNACYGVGCIARTPYSFNGKRRIACHGRMHFLPVAEDFMDARRLLNAIDGVVRA